jgi:hypothetical protein
VPISPTEASAVAHETWARTTDRSARTAKARQARWQRYLAKARELQGPHATPEAVARAAEHLRQADMKRMALASLKTRRANRDARLAREAEARKARQSADDGGAT